MMFGIRLIKVRQNMHMRLMKGKRIKAMIKYAKNKFIQQRKRKELTEIQINKSASAPKKREKEENPPNPFQIEQNVKRQKNNF